MRGVHRYPLTSTTARLTRPLALLLVAFAITVPSIAVARATRTHSPVHLCGVVQVTVGVVEQGGVSCARPAPLNPHGGRR
jgi:hypothetical protein